MIGDTKTVLAILWNFELEVTIRPIAIVVPCERSGTHFEDLQDGIDIGSQWFSSVDTDFELLVFFRLKNPAVAILFFFKYPVESDRHRTRTCDGVVILVRLGFHDIRYGLDGQIIWRWRHLPILLGPNSKRVGRLSRHIERLLPLIA